MLRSMMQVYVKGSVEAVNLYQKAFDAEILGLYPDDNGGYAHSELKAYGQVLAVSELKESLVIGNTMQFCFHFGEGGEQYVRKAYEVLRDGAEIHFPIGPCDYSSCMFSLIDKFGVYWCLFV
ncbi:MAG: VOC family protein [Ruminococcaceae bacterium]|nr:VOC family protein [Oscillospiraceae bacterium]